MKNLNFFSAIILSFLLCCFSCKKEDTTPRTSCFDGIQNGTETGVDCGGDCVPCPTCSDGIQNGNETGIDCGGDCTDCINTFDKTIERSNHAIVSSFETSDKKITLYGRVRNTKEIFLASADREANLFWEKTIELDGSPNDAIETSNGDFLIVGRIDNSIPIPGSPSDAVIIRTNNSGVLLWKRSLNLGRNSQITKIIPAADNGYIILIEVEQLDNAIVAKIDDDGKIIWEKTYNDTLFTSLTEGDGGYILMGENISSEKPIFIKVDFSGNVIWNTTIDQGQDLFGKDLILMPNNDIISIGEETFNNLGYILKLDPNGNLLFIDYTSEDLLWSKVLYDKNQSVIVVGGKWNSTGSDLSLHRFDQNGNQEINTIIEKCSWSPNSTEIYKEADGGYLLIGKETCENGTKELIGFVKVNDQLEL